MAFKKKTWTDRVAEFINRRTLTKEDGSTELVTVARSEGTISKEGDAFNAETMNDLEQRIEDGFEALNKELEKKVSTADIVNNLTSDLKNKPLAAYQGKVLKSYIDVMCGGDGNTGQTGEALRLLGKSDTNCVYGNYNFGIYFVDGSEEGLPLTGYSGFLITLRWTTSRMVKVLFLVNAYTYVMAQENDGMVVSSWSQL